MAYTYRKIRVPLKLKKGDIVIYNATTKEAQKKGYFKEYIELKIQSRYDVKKGWIKAKVNRGKNKGNSLEILRGDFPNGIIFSRHQKK